MWACYYCNELNDKRRKSCSFCGCRRKDNKRKILMIILIVLLVIMAALIVLSHYSETKSYNENPTEYQNTQQVIPSYTPMPTPTFTSNLNEKF